MKYYESNSKEAERRYKYEIKNDLERQELLKEYYTIQNKEYDTLLLENTYSYLSDETFFGCIKRYIKRIKNEKERLFN